VTRDENVFEKKENAPTLSDATDAFADRVTCRRRSCEE
jgi:hypothetical protein